jgi:hypothetical protein
MKHVDSKYVFEFTEKEIHVLVDSLIYAQGMTQEELDAEDIGVTVAENIDRVNKINDQFIELISIKV